MLPTHFAGGFAKVGIFPSDKHAILEQKHLQSPTAAVLDESNSQSNTAEDTNNPTTTDGNISRPRRSSSCPRSSSSGVKTVPFKSLIFH